MRRSKRSVAIGLGEGVAEDTWKEYQERPESFPRGLFSLPDLCARTASVHLGLHWVFPSHPLDKGPEPEYKALAAWTAHQKFLDLAGLDK
jgi:hypothetical protein